MLAPIDFSDVREFEPLETGIYQGETESWELAENKAGDGQHVLAKFKVFTDDDKVRTLFHRWSLKPQALWRIKRDLIAMGSDPAALEGKSVDIEQLLNDHFADPEPVELSVRKTTYTPNDGGEPRQQNELVSVKSTV